MYKNPKWLNSQNTVMSISTDVSEWVISLPTEEPTAKQVAKDAVAGLYGEITPYAPPASVVPVSITMRQCRLQLLAIGKLDAVDAVIDSMPSPSKEQAEIEWEYAGVVLRSSQLVAGLGPALGLSGAELDKLFIDAAKL